jgi:predicted transposase YdaD
LLSASAILAGLRLEQEAINQLVRSDIMQDSVIYRSIQDEQKREIALNSLREGLSVEMTARITGLSLKEVQTLQRQVNASSQA